MPHRDLLLIDDKSYGIRQIEAAIPAAHRHECTVHHMASMAEYRAAGAPRMHVVLLDFFLDLDRTFGHLVANEIAADHLVGFSSSLEGSQAIADAVRNRSGEPGAPQAHAVQKRKDSDHNPELTALFAAIL